MGRRERTRSVGGAYSKVRLGRASANVIEGRTERRRRRLLPAVTGEASTTRRRRRKSLLRIVHARGAIPNEEVYCQRELEGRSTTQLSRGAGADQPVRLPNRLFFIFAYSM